MTETAYHYRVIARAIDHIVATAHRQPTLEELAAAVDLSPAHFQRIFSQWAGVSPKRYQQYLTLDHARTLLRDRHTVLDTADETGLSGAGRLHDLFVRWEAMTPGEFAQGADGVAIWWDRVDTPFGEALVMATGRGICGLGFTAGCGFDAAFADLAGRWPAARFQQDESRVGPHLGTLFGGDDPARLHLIGGPFQIKVWEALLRVPQGHVTTYSDIAAAIGSPGAVRAVGTAVGRNPVSWLIPCHRALRKSGGLGGYHWGLATKRAMLAWEAVRHDARQGGGHAKALEL